MTQYSLQQIFTQYPPNNFGLKLPLYQLKALDAITACRTQKMGSHGQYCEQGHLCGVFYNSCRHRGCPQCQSVKREQWLADWSARLLDTQHHHWIFTCPHELLPLWRFNRAWFQGLLFKSMAETLKTLFADKQHLGVQAGFLLALHTWGRNLSDHPHIHCLMTHGGLDDAGKWQQPRSKSLLPAEVVKRMFRGKLIAKLKAGINKGELILPNAETSTSLINLLNKLGRVKWQIYACKAYEHGFGVAKYLARYMCGGALKNHQITKIKDGLVHFRYHDHRSQKMQRSRYSIADFEQQILRHLPLPNQQSMRYYGFYHPSQIARLNQARLSQGQAKYKTPALPDWQAVMDKFGLTIDCVICEELERQAATGNEQSMVKNTRH